jgi:hypothetical protein
MVTAWAVGRLFRSLIDPRGFLEELRAKKDSPAPVQYLLSQRSK